jgi:hypothetical protein
MRRIQLAPILLTVLTVIVCIWGIRSGWLASTTATNVVLIVTAVIILAYTWATDRLRRNDDRRMRRESQPALYYRLLAPAALVGGAPPTVHVGPTPQAGPVMMRFRIRNANSNTGLARVRVRLHHGGLVGTLAGSGAYDGTRVWEITPYYNLVGVFDLVDLVLSASPPSRQNAWPVGHATLSVQLDLYDVDALDHVWSTTTEYRFEHQPTANRFEFWPEVSALVLPRLEALPALPTNWRDGLP